MSLRRKILIVVGIVLGVAILIPVIRHYQLRAAVNEHIAELKAKGEPMDLAQVIPPPVPPEENSAPLITNALTQIYLESNYTNSIIFNNPPYAMNRTIPGKEMIGWRQLFIHDPEGYGGGYPMLKTFFQPLIAWYLAALKTAGYPVIVLLMTMESSFLPLPSEVIIPPAAHLAWSGDGINFFSFHFTGFSAQIGLIIAGAFGSWLGATIMYWLARMAGRPLVLRFGKFVLFPPEKLEKAERWMAHYGAMGVFIARLLPGARQLVGIPAGIARMDYLKFSIFTLLGSTIWCAVLCYVGVKAGQDAQLMHGELHHVALWLGGAVIFLGGFYYFFVHRHMKKKS